MKALEYFQRQREVGGNYAGQLEEEFQGLLAEEHSKIDPEKYHFYHTTEAPDGKVYEGGWDLRGTEQDYLGHIDLKGLRVLELGPASGHLSFFMEEQGARVVSFDLPPGSAPDLLPIEGIDLEAHAVAAAEFAAGVRATWWYLHRLRGSLNCAVYGDIYHLPPDLGQFDVATFGSILLHLARPFSGLEQVSRLARAIVVTELIHRPEAEQEAPYLEFAPGEPPSPETWWGLRPGAVIRMLQLLGYQKTSLSFHRQKHFPAHKLESPPIRAPLFTVVGEREPPVLKRLDSCPGGSHSFEVSAGPSILGQAIRLSDLEERIKAMEESTSWRLTQPLRFLGDWLKRS